jgi:hypothetical protein
MLTTAKSAKSLLIIDISLVFDPEIAYQVLVRASASESDTLAHGPGGGKAAVCGEARIAARLPVCALQPAIASMVAAATERATHAIGDLRLVIFGSCFCDDPHFGDSGVQPHIAR